jgi:hypothetical protein
MTDEAEQSIPSRGSQPVAWGNEDDDGIYAVGPTEAHAHYVWERAANGKFRHRNPRIVPLYRQPQPPLTDEEREAMDAGADALEGLASNDNDGRIRAALMIAANTLRGFLNRTK